MLGLRRGFYSTGSAQRSYELPQGHSSVQVHGLSKDIQRPEWAHAPPETARVKKETSGNGGGENGSVGESQASFGHAVRFLLSAHLRIHLWSQLFSFSYYLAHMFVTKRFGPYLL